MREHAKGEIGTFREMAVSGQALHQDGKWSEEKGVRACFGGPKLCVCVCV